MRRLCICLVLLLFVLPVSSETFQAVRHLSVSILGGAAIQADFNGDGLPDFFYYYPAYTPDSSIKAEVLLSHPDGTYSDPLTLSLDGTPHQCRAYDVNNDHLADVVCASLASGSPSQQVMYTFIGKGDGTFQSSIRTNIFINNSYTSLAVIRAGDINGDGKLDIILFDLQQLNAIYPMLGDGAGNFTVGKPLNLARYNLVARPLTELSDINGDGKLDLLFGDPLQVYLGNGDGTFTSGFISGNDGNCHFADFDTDQHLDALCVEYSLQNFTNVILHGNPDGTFNVTPIALPDLGKIASFLATKDLNGDGISDVIGSGNEGMIVYLGKPGLQFAPPISYSIYTGYGNVGLNDPLIGDYNGDGTLDLATTAFDGIYIAYGRGDGSFSAPRPTESGTAIGGIAVGDFDEDGAPDVITSGSPSLLLNHGKEDGTFATSTPIQRDGLAANAGISSQVFQGDFNGDGHLDLLTNNNSLPQIFFGKGDSTFNDPVLASSTFNFIPMSGAVIADVNGDGRADLIAPYNSYPTGAVWVMLSNGDGSFSAQSIASFNSTLSVAASDVNGDNKLDLVVSIVGGIQILLGKGDGTFDQIASAPSAPSIGNTSFNAGQAVFGDFDGDGKRDFAVAATNSLSAYYLTIYYGNGDGTFSAPSTITTGVVSTGLFLNLAAQDLNGDGLDDLLYSGSSVYQAAEISILHAKPGRTFDAGMGLLAGFGTLTPSIVDFNKDGRPDLLFSNSYASPGIFTVLLNRESTGTTLTVDHPAIQYGQGAGFTAQVTFSADSTSAPPPSATVTLSGLPGSPVTLPIAFSSPGAGTARYEAINLLPGTYNVTARLNASCCLTPSKSAITTLVVAPAATTTTLALTPVPPLTGQPATLRAQVSSQTTVTSGTITFFDQGTQIGTAPVASGAASFATSPLSAGTHSITAVFASDQNFLASSSQPLTLTVFDSGYQLTAAQTNLSLGANGSTDLVTLSPVQGFYGKVTLSCSVTPADSITAATLPTCSLSPSVVALTGTPVNSTLTISDNKSSTTAASASVLPGGWVGLCLVVLVSALSRRQNRLSWSAFATLVVMHAVTLLSGCAGRVVSPSAAANAAIKNYTVTVTASSDMPGSAPAPLTITVHRE